MSPLLTGPVPVVAGSENWTDDPSFDFGSTHISLGSSSSSSTNSFHSSPLRASSRRAQDIVEEDEDDWDLHAEPQPLQLKSHHQPAVRNRDFSSVSTPTHSQQRISHRPRTSTSSLVEAGQVMGTGPKGVGVIKKLGSSSTSSMTPNPVFFQRKEKAVALDWESDIDFGDEEVKKHPRLALSPRVPKGNANDLDDLEAFMDDDDDRGQDTLKAGNTIKGLLPPPKHRNVATIKSSTSNSNVTLATTFQIEAEDFEFESAFSLPLTLSHLSLASGSSPSSSPKDHRSKPRNSQSSCSTWDSPATSGHGRSFGPSSGRSGQSETSATSFSAGFATEQDIDVKILGAQPEGDEMDDDMEDGLVLPTPSFFSSGRINELNSLLDRKRKQVPAAPAAVEQRQEESFEDGLVFSGSGRSELTQNRLIKGRKARTLPLPIPSGSTHARRSVAVQGRATTGRERDRELERKKEREREREREQGWNRPKSPGPNSLLGLRSNSATSIHSPALVQSFRRPESPLVGTSSRLGYSGSSLAEQPSGYGSIRSRGAVNIPPPTPSNAGAYGSMRLRHQKSQQRLIQPPPSPTLARKPSLASLQDAMARPAPPQDAEIAHGSLRRKANLGLMLPPAASTPQPSRLTMPTASSLARARPAIGGVFPRSEPKPVVARVMNAPKRVRAYGDGTELEGIEDLSVDREQEASRDKQAHGASRVGLGRPTSRRVPHDPSVSRREEPVVPEKRKKTPTGSTKRVLDATKTKSGRPRKPALLIKNLGGVDKRKVVGEMTWNPQTLRWEGNENVLRDFDNPLASSVRPALIAHFTGSSVGVPSPTVGATQTIRIVGDMRFDPERMCWVSNLAPEDDEPDPFEGMADDEDDDNGGGSTITRAQGRKVASTIMYGGSGAWSSRLASESSASTSMGSTFDGEDERLWEECKAAEDRHRVEMRGWTTKSLGGAAEARDRERREEKRLWEIRNLAMRS